jgi:hypothetical protein
LSPNLLHAHCIETVGHCTHTAFTAVSPSRGAIIAMNSHLLGAAYLLHRSGSFFATAHIFAQATGLDTAIGGGMGILARIAYLGAFAMIIAASWQVQRGQSEHAKWAVMGALIAAVASLIVKALFATGDIPINITPTSGN